MASISNFSSPTHFTTDIITANTTTLTAIFQVVEARPTAAANWTLPVISLAMKGGLYWIINESAFNITLAAGAGNTISGGANITIGSGATCNLLVDFSTNWVVVSNATSVGPTPIVTIPGDLASFSNTTGGLQDSGIAETNVPLLNAFNTWTGSNNVFQNGPVNVGGVNKVNISSTTISIEQAANSIQLVAPTLTTTTILTLPAVNGTLVTGPTSVTNGDLVSYNGTNGTIQDSGVSSSFINQSVTSTSTPSFTGIQLATTGGTPATLNYYETGTITCNFTGAATTSVTASFVRVGSAVTFTLPTSVVTVTAATNFTTAAGTIPTRLLSNQGVTGVQFLIAITNAGSVQSTPGLLALHTDGSLLITPDIAQLSNFTSGQNGGWPHTMTFCWQTS